MTSTEKYSQYLDQPESRRLEFKERLPQGDRLARTAVALANGAGGKIVFGIKDSPREIIGVDENRLFELKERINNSIFDQCAPSIVPEVYLQSISGKTLLVVEIFPGSNKPCYLKSKGKHEGTYIRVGSVNRKASLEIIEELERQRRKGPFDSLPLYDLSTKNIDL
jgi:predicted HTH transcriptional regulator